MKKILGILGLLVFLCLITALLNPDVFLTDYNLRNLVRRISLFAIISIGVTFVIITGGIDLSIGSVVALVACLLPWYLVREGMSVTAALTTVLLISLGIGLFHGLLITKLNLQPFVVTLCGLLIYRGQARGTTRDQTMGFGNLHKPLRYLASGSPFEMYWLIIGVGALMVILALLPRRHGERYISRPVGLVIGVLLVAIGASPKWWGFHFQTPAMEPDAYAALSFWSRGIVDLKAAEPLDVPSLLLFWTGFLGLIIGGGWFVIRSLFAARRTAIPLILAIVSCISAVLLCRSAIGAWPHAVEVGLQRDKLFLVIRLALGLGLAAASITFFAQRSFAAIGSSLRSPLVLALAGGIMCLIGFTPLPQIMVPMPFLIMLFLGIAAAVFLNNTIWGRYLMALGRNEQAARYSGINTHAMIILAYVICSLFAGLGGMLFVLDVNSAQPADFGNMYELYAITAAVLGGCSLRGGEGTIAGVLIGAAVMQVLRNSILILDFDNSREGEIIGIVLLVGVIVDELTKRVAARRKLVT